MNRDYGLARVPVWDPVTRYLHWHNAFFMAVQIATAVAFMAGGHGEEDGPGRLLVTAHAASGFLFGAGLAARIIWLFVGPSTARLGDMLPVSPANQRVFGDTVRFYLRGLRGHRPLYLAHNPLAGPAYVLFFIVGAVQVVSGSMVLSMPESLRAEGLPLEVHEAGFFLLLLYIAAHIAAVFIHELTEDHGLVSAMINGRKTFTEDERDLLAESNPEAMKGAVDDWKD